MVGVSIINWVIFPLAHIRRKRFSVVIIRLWVIGLAITPNKILQKRVRARRIVRRVRQRQNILILPNRKPLNLPKLWVF